MKFADEFLLGIRAINSGGGGGGQSGPVSTNNKCTGEANRVHPSPYYYYYYYYFNF